MNSRSLRIHSFTVCAGVVFSPHPALHLRPVHSSASMAHADDVKVRVFSLNCWLVADLKLKSTFRADMNANITFFLSLFGCEGASGTSARSCLSATPWSESCCAEGNTTLSCCKRLVVVGQVAEPQAGSCCCSWRTRTQDNLSVFNSV